MTTRADISEQLDLAEASAWLVRLQDEARRPGYEAAFRDWLAEDPAHARAFERVTDTWELVPAAARAARAAASRQQQSRRHPPLRAMLAGLAMAAFLAVGVTVMLPSLRDPVYETAIGGQQSVLLDDGTRITLNTNTRLSVHYAKDLRRIHLDHGEAMFEVAKNPQRPFIVESGDERVRALGTTFVVRNDLQRTDVLLIEGRVQVTSASSGAPPVLLEPGERLLLRGATTPRTLDRPPVEEVTAWRRSEAMFDNATLADAVAEINRYGRTQVEIRDPEVAALRVSGVFATRDPVEFANVIARLHKLEVVPAPGGGVILAADHSPR
ncbi:FecR domain-containing protein [Pelomonas sp. KK5]|uniref:FecR family protein n=1 Tax=Pelomonas sp. KK5 TaxID=1855730 RepID=UPI0009FA5297|nr:FecR domain-containing protein [Pelomonas sp. KK5]